MNRIGIFICNYNGKNWCENCIESLFSQSIKEFDIFIVDNASTDGSVEYLEKKFKNKISFIINKTNLGGSGGFNRGILTGLSKGYDYVTLLDNDIVLDTYSIENMYDYLEKNKDVGIVGSKVMIMDAPDFIQDYGCILDFDTFREIPQYVMKKENEVPSEHECDYVPTCAVMIKADALKKSGGMPEDNFIYYDDIELSYKIKQSGYKVIALGTSKIFHKGGFRKVVKNTFPKYYFLRNRLNFFSKYIKTSEEEKFIRNILEEIYSLYFGYFTKGKSELLNTIIFAYNDYLCQIRGKAKDNRILDLMEHKMPFEEVIENSKKVIIEFRELNNDIINGTDSMTSFYRLKYLLDIIHNTNNNCSIYLALENSSYSKDEFSKIFTRLFLDKKENQEANILNKIIFLSNDIKYDSSYLYLVMCEHVKNIKENILPKIWVDGYANCISNEKEYIFARSYYANFNFFYSTNKILMKEAIKNIKKSCNKNE